MKFVNFLKSRLIFILIVSECFQTNFSHLSRAYISKIKRCFNVKSSTYYFQVKKKIMADFQICLSVPLNIECGSTKTHKLCKKRYFFEIGLNNYSIDALLISEKISPTGLFVKPNFFRIMKKSNLLNERSEKIFIISFSFISTC